MKSLCVIVACGLAGLALPAAALAQCSTADLDGNGIPDVCPPGSNYVQGTVGFNIIFGTNQNDCIFAFGGNDLIFALGGDDYICGGDGNDLILGGDGNDYIDGGAGNDTINGGAGDDTLNGGTGDDTLNGGGGTNACVEEVPGSSQGLTNCAVTTYAAVDSFEVVNAHNGVTVIWNTTTEVGTVAFRLWGVEGDGQLRWVGEIDTPLDESPFGAQYFLRDASAPSEGSVEYVLEERTVSGGSVQYGPFVRSPSAEDRADWPLSSGLSQARVPRVVALKRLSHPASAKPMNAFRRKSSGTATGAVLVVDHPGVVEVDAATIATALETSADEVKSLIRSGGLHLRLRGESIAWHADDDGAALRFVAPEIRSPFSTEHRYLLTVEEGVTMLERTLIRAGTVEPHTFLETKRFEQNVFSGPSGGPDPRQDLFFWHALSSNAEAVIAATLPAISDSEAEELRVVVHGATEHLDQPHRVELLWNGASLGLFDLFGRQRHTITVPLSALGAGAQNEIVVRQHVAGTAPPVLYVDAAEVDYVRFAEADGPAFSFGGARDGLCTVTGIDSPTVSLYDVTEPGRPAYYGEVLLEEGESLSFQADGPDLRFLIATPQSVSAPRQVLPHVTSNLRSTEHDADYVIIAASHLLADSQALADLREADGYRVLLVDVEDVYWEFADGEPDPLSIRDFLRFARQRWKTAPRFAALIGKGSLDYRDLRGLGGNWLPSPLAPTDGGLFPSDSMLGDVEGDDGVPEIAIGRLPVTTGEELDLIIAAIESFEASQRSADALFAADDSEREEFISAARLLASWTTPERTEEIDLNTETIESARQRLASIWAGSLSWLSYVGHGGLDRIANEGLLTSADVPALAGMQGKPVVLGWSCNIARFDIPGFFSLGEKLLTEGSSAGVFSATGWSNHVETDALRTAFAQAAFASDAETIGEAMIRAHRAANDAPLALHRVYMLLGDPALRLRAPKAQPDPEPDPDPDPGFDPDPAVDPAPITVPDQTDGPPRIADDPSGSGCEIVLPGRARAPFGPTLVLVALMLAIRRRLA
ncbi:MAG: C25 family cysteine peptidase [Polyangiales bacterium]